MMADSAPLPADRLAVVADPVLGIRLHDHPVRAHDDAIRRSDKAILQGGFPIAELANETRRHAHFPLDPYRPLPAIL